MSSSVPKWASQTSCNVLLCTAFPLSTSSLRSDSSSTNTTRKSNSRITGGRCFKNCSRSTGGDDENSSSNSNACSSNKQYVRNNCRNENSVPSKHNSAASIRFMNTPSGGACGGRRRFFILLPLTLLFFLRHHICTVGRHYEPETAASPATSSSRSHHEWRIFSRRGRKRSTESALSASAAEPTGASLFPTSLQEREHLHELSPPLPDTESDDRAGRLSLLQRRKTSDARVSLRTGLLKRLSRPSKDFRKSYYSSDSDSITPPTFDSPSIEKEFFSTEFDSSGDFHALTPGCAGESRTTCSDTSEGYGSTNPYGGSVEDSFHTSAYSTSTAPDTPTSSGGIRRRKTTAFQRLRASFRPRGGRASGETTDVVVEKSEATTAESRAQQQGEGRDQQEKLQQKEEHEEQQYGAQLNLTSFSSATEDAQVAIQPLPSLSRADSDGTKADSFSASVPSSAAAGSVVATKPADLQHRLSLGAPQYTADRPSGGDDFVRKTDETPHPSAVSGPPQKPAEISAANHKQRAKSLGRVEGDEGGLPVDLKKDESHKALWESLRNAVARFQEAKRLATFALLDIENACAHQHSSLDEFIGLWVAKAVRPKTTLSEMSALVKNQERTFRLVQKADSRCKRMQTALQRVNRLYTPSVDAESSEEFSFPSLTTPTAPECPSLACSEPHDIPPGENNASSISKNSYGMEEAEGEGALAGLRTTIRALQLEALSTASRCVAIKEEVSYTYIRLLYWLTAIRAPELRTALLEAAAASAKEGALTSLRQGSRELLSPYIRREVCPTQVGQGLPERAKKVVDVVNFAAGAVWKIFENIRQCQVHLDVWLSSLVRGFAKGKQVLGEIQRLKELQAEGSREADNIFSILQVQRISWSWTVDLVERQLREQPRAFNSTCTCNVLWNAAKEIVITKAELYYLIKASGSLNRKLTVWEKYFHKAVNRKTLRRRAT